MIIDRLEIGIGTSAAAENTSLHLCLRFRSRDVIMELCTSWWIIDFGSLFKVTVSIEVSDEGEASQELFRRCDEIFTVIINISNCSLLHSGETTNC